MIEFGGEYYFRYGCYSNLPIPDNKILKQFDNLTSWEEFYLKETEVISLTIIISTRDISKSIYISG